MKKIFLSFSFRAADRELVAAIEQLLASHQIQVSTGRRLGGEPLTEAIKEKINQADGLVALLTRREQLANGGWTTHDWVRDELNFARQANKKAIALVEAGVQIGGAYANHEHIPFNRAESLLDAFLAVSDTIGVWKIQAGRLIKVRIMPENLAREPRLLSGQAQLQYRYLSGGEFTRWQTILPVPEVGATVVYLPGSWENNLIQLQIIDGPVQWLSPATPQLIEIKLDQITGGST